MPKLSKTVTFAGVGLVAGKFAFDRYGWKLGALLLQMKFDKDVKNAGLSYRSVRLSSGQESWFLERPGKSNVPTLILVPGFTTPAEQCAEWVLHLKVPPDRRIIILDLPGHGRNRQASVDDVSFSSVELLEWFSNVLQELDVDTVDIYAFSTGAGIIAAHLNSSSMQRPVVRHAALLNPFCAETANEKFIAAEGGKLFGWNKGSEFLTLVSEWLNVSAKLPGFIVQAVEHERQSWPENYWRDLGEKLASHPISVVGSQRPTDPKLDVLIVWGEKDKVTDFSKCAAFVAALPAESKVMKIPNCGHAGIDGSATDTIFSASAPQVSEHFFGAPSKL